MQDDDIDLPPDELESMLLIERLAEGMQHADIHCSSTPRHMYTPAYT